MRGARSSAGGRDAKASVAGVGCAVEHALARPAWPRLVGAQDVLERYDVTRGLDAIEVELLDLLDVVEDAGQLAGHPLDLLFREAQARELRHVQDLVATDHLT